MAVVLKAWGVAVLLGGVALLTSCGADGSTPDPAVPGENVSVSPTPESSAGGVAECTNEEARYTVAYPDDWETNSGEIMPACSLFDPGRIEIGAGSEIPPDIAVMILREAAPYSAVTAEDPSRDDSSREPTTVDGKPALRVEGVTTGVGLYDRGMPAYHYFVDLAGETLVASTFGAGSLDFESKKDVLDRMMASIRIQ